MAEVLPAEFIRRKDGEPNNVDAAIKSALFHSFAVSQGGETTQSYALRMQAGLFPRQNAYFAIRLARSTVGLVDQLGASAEGFVAGNKHPGSVGGGRRTGYMLALREMRDSAEHPPVTEHGLNVQALQLGATMIGRDRRYLTRTEGRNKPPSDTYTLLGASHNSHFLHYAYLEDPEKLPKGSMQLAACYAARFTANVIACQDLTSLADVGFCRLDVDNLRIATSTHLAHYPEHADQVSPSFLTAVADNALRRALPTADRDYPYAAELPV